MFILIKAIKNPYDKVNNKILRRTTYSTIQVSSSSGCVPWGRTLWRMSRMRSTRIPPSCSCDRCTRHVRTGRCTLQDPRGSDRPWKVLQQQHQQQPCIQSNIWFGFYNQFHLQVKNYLKLHSIVSVYFSVFLRTFSLCIVFIQSHCERENNHFRCRTSRNWC